MRLYDTSTMYVDHPNGVREVLDTEAYDEPFSVATCGACGRSWDDDRASGLTPTPSGRCPFEYEHEHEDATEGDGPARGIAREIIARGDTIASYGDDPWTVWDAARKLATLVLLEES